MLLAARARKAAFLCAAGGSRRRPAHYTQPWSSRAVRFPTAERRCAPARALFRDACARRLELSSAESPRRAGTPATRSCPEPGGVCAPDVGRNAQAADLFRLAVARTRDIARTEAEIATLGAKPAPSPRDVEDLAAAKSNLEALRGEQVKLQSQLADFPRYKVLAPSRTELSELRGAVRPGEGYYKLTVVGERVYGIYATNGGARALRLASTRGMLTDEVSAIRRSIAETVG